MTVDIQGQLAEQIEAIESAYEFMLAYAAQGRSGDQSDQQINQFLSDLDVKLDNISDGNVTLVTGEDPLGFAELVQDDAKHALAAVRLVRLQPQISSQLIDNLNASIHLRTLLTDLFLVDEVGKQPQQ